MKDLAALAVAAIGFWKWYQSRNAAVLKRVSRLLGDDGEKLRRATTNSLSLLIRPSPQVRPLQPAFAAHSLQRVLTHARIGTSLGQETSLKKAFKHLNRSHRDLDSREKTANDYVRNVHEQRYAAHKLQGAISSARASRAKLPGDVARFNTDALNNFIAASRVPVASEFDHDLEELIARHQFLCGHADVAETAFVALQRRLLDELERDRFESDEARDAARSRLIRVVRYRAEMLHASGTYQSANLICLELAGKANPHAVMSAPLINRDRLDRAEFHMFHAAVRLHQNRSVGGVAGVSVNDARTDFEAVISSQRVSFFEEVLGFCFARRPARARRALLKDAKAGLATLEQMGRSLTCAFCQSEDAARSKSPSP